MIINFSCKMYYNSKVCPHSEDFSHFTATIPHRNHQKNTCLTDVATERRRASARDAALVISPKCSATILRTCESPCCSSGVKCGQISWQRSRNFNPSGLSFCWVLVETIWDCESMTKATHLLIIVATETWNLAGLWVWDGLKYFGLACRLIWNCRMWWLFPSNKSG